MTMRHARHYTVEQADAALPWVAERLQRLRGARELLDDLDARELLSAAAPSNGGGAPGRVVSEGFIEMRTALGELQAVDVVVRDLDPGRVDFPALRDGQEIYLCWAEHEPRVGFWHGLDAGFEGREPV